MLHLYHSNSMESLLQELLAVLERPLQDPFAAEIVLVQNQGMARWLTLAIAKQQGVASNIEFPLPARFIWRLFELQLQRVPDSSAFDREALLWRAMALLPNVAARSGCEEIAGYLQGADAALKSYQLSRRVADLFDQYLVYRPELIAAWEQGSEQHWQAQLWRAMRAQSAEPHRAALIRELRESLDKHGAAAGLPQRIALFGISALPPHYLETLAAVAQHLEVHLFLLNPSLNYWGDIVSAKDQARLRQSWRRLGRSGVPEFYAEGNPLLASLGKQGRDFLDQLHEYESVEADFFADPGEGTLLQCLQGDILMLRSRGQEGLAKMQLAGNDASISIHSCHSAMREVQVLHDQLLSLFDARDDLMPQDIVVMAPDIERLAPAVESVFGGAPPQRHIPYSIADHAAAAHAPLVETLLQWLELSTQRFDAPTVLAWLELPALQRRFRFDRQAVERIRTWVAGSGVRWGVDGRHRAEFGSGSDAGLNSWAFGLQRLFLGYAMPHHVSLYRSVAPYGDIEGSEAAWLGELQAFIELLDGWRRRLAAAATPERWQRRINRMIEQLLLPDEDEEQCLGLVREALQQFVEESALGGFDAPLEARVVHQHLASQLDAAAASQRFLTGRVTFCNMVPMRSIPFRVVCLLGMNDSDYPRVQTPLGFDLVAQQPRRGDRSRREDDRYLFMESLLCARERLYISYIGRSQRDNSVKLPSVVVSELLDYIEQGYTLEGDGEIRAQLHTEHPLQPFSRRNFTLGSYAAEWLPAATASRPFIEESLAIPGEPVSEVALDALIRFFDNPSRHFLQSLGLYNAEHEEALEESEPFALDALGLYQLKSGLLHGLLEGDDAETCYRRVAARGELPHGSFGEILFSEEAEGLREFAEALAQRLQRREARREIVIEAAGIELSGRLEVIVDGGLCSYRPGRLKPRDQLRLWIGHLALCASGGSARSMHLATDRQLFFEALDSSDAVSQLAALLSLYSQGAAAPLPFFAATSYAFAKKIADGKEDDALPAAARAWEGSQFIPGERLDPWFEQAMRDREPLDERFCEIAERVYLPMLNAVGKG
jgi:exodeoxyribonuclease V gamma subunit